MGEVNNCVTHTFSLASIHYNFRLKDNPLLVMGIQAE